MYTSIIIYKKNNFVKGINKFNVQVEFISLHDFDVGEQPV
jgi:hypothetical protein